MDPPTASELADRLRGLRRRTTPTLHEEGCIVELDGFRLAGLILEPADRPLRRTGLVVCPSLFEAPRFHSAEINIARGAAAAGFPAIYLHPPGFGESEGTHADADARQRIDTALSATRLLEERYESVDATCLCGIGFGATVALACASRARTDPPLVLWEPVVDVDAYWAEAKRNSRIWYMRNARAWREPETFMETNREAAVLTSEVLVTRRLLSSLAAVRDGIDVQGGTSAALVVSSDPNLDAVLGLLGSSRSPDTRLFTDSELGWASKGQREAADATITWMEGSLG